MRLRAIEENRRREAAELIAFRQEEAEALAEGDRFGHDMALPHIALVATWYGEKHPDRYAVYGYESMSLILDAIKRAGVKGNDRAAVVDQVFATKDRQGVFGTYSIDKNGDITLTPYGIYRVRNGELVFDHSVQGQA